MRRISFLMFLSIVLFSHKTEAKNPPNVILILADDLGYGDLGCYGQQKIITPHIDELAQNGRRYTNAYAGSSVCAPSRSSLMTGMHNGHNRVRDNLPHGVYLKPNDFTIGELFKQSGYKTGCIGKWGLGTAGSWGTPMNQGFDYFYGHLNQDQAHFYYPDYLWENDEVKLLQEMVMEGDVGKLKGNRGGEERFYTNDLFTEKAIEFIKENKENPFFLYLPYTLPHFSDYPKDSPKHFQVPNDHPYSNKDWTQHQKNYAAMVTRLDRDVGSLTALISQLDLDDNTLIIFTSDNGPYLGVPNVPEFFNSSGEHRGGKRDMYEGGLKIPFIVKWDKMIKRNSIDNQQVAFWDLMATFADLIDYPDELSTDGISILPSFIGETNEDRKPLFWDYGHVRSTYKQALIKGDYKLIRTINEKVVNELYHLPSDPREEKNIADKNPNVVESLTKAINKSIKYDPNYFETRNLKTLEPATKTFPKVPGIVVNHRPASSGEYVGAPSITISPEGDYFVSLNFTEIARGDKGAVHKTDVFKSSDQGQTWIKTATIEDQRWSTIFFHRNELYVIGTFKAFGDLIIRKSVDGGKTWTEPKDANSGLLAKGRYHTAPVPVISHNGRLWRAMEYAEEGRDFRAFAISIPEDKDLLKAENWTISTKIKPDSTWNNGTMSTWLEGNVVVNPEGEMVNILRTQFSDETGDKAAMIKISSDGKTSTYAEQSIISLPGATGKKFTIKYDEKSKKYWALVNWIQPQDRKKIDLKNKPGKFRNALSLISSKNLTEWIIEQPVLYHPDHKFHAFQYVDWIIEGDDILAVSRTAFDDEMGGADSHHNANFITFHRITSFRKNLDNH